MTSRPHASRFLTFCVLLGALLVGGTAAAEDVWAVDGVQSVRFPDTDAIPGPYFSKDAKLEVLFRDGARIRVRESDRYGWISAAAVTDQAPEGADEGKAGKGKAGKAKAKGKAKGPR